MNENNDRNIKKLLESESVPEELSPENIKKMLDEKAPVRKRNKIAHKAARITAVAAACAVICGFGAHYAEQGSLFNKNKFNTHFDQSESYQAVMEESSDITGSSDASNQESSAEKNTSEVSVSDLASENITEQKNGQSDKAFMSGASDYGELYYMLEKASERYRTNSDYKYYTDEVMESAAEVGTERADADSAVNGIGGGDVNEPDYSDTYNQESGVLEADIAKTDGKYIYYLCKYSEAVNTENQYINIAEADNGSFADAYSLNISGDFPVPDGENCDRNIILEDMYLYNDMLIVIAQTYIFEYSGDDIDENGLICGIMDDKIMTCVNVYTTGINPQLIGTYSQDGSYNDVRITPEGYMYLITGYYSKAYDDIDGIDDIASYIPSYSVNGGTCLVAPEDILLPGEEMQECNYIAYTIVGSLDFNNMGSFTETDIKAVAGFSGNIYCSGTNLYTACGWEQTSITRIALDKGIITPAASGTIDGYIKDQFSMSEYNGYFRAAATIETWSETFFDDFVSYGRDGINNCVYVLDMDLNEVGKISDFGIDESIKSVNFSGDIAYVVTYEQTDPLFSIDLSNPEQPVILDEYKILGYSTYMQQWSDGLLLGFGANADENGIEDGVKIVMFDNSDPNDLREVGIYQLTMKEIDPDSSIGWLTSDAIWERKALLIAPEKNLIGVPVTISGSRDETYDWYHNFKYVFFSYEDGQFVMKGELFENDGTDFGFNSFQRVVYIGDYVYGLSGERFVSASISDIAVTDTVEFR